MKDELTEMRNQIAILKTKLENQDIINDKMMHQVVCTKSDSMKKKIVISILCALFVIIVGPFSFHYSLGTSWYFVIGTDIAMLYCMMREYRFKRRISDHTLMNATLLEVAKTIQEFKQDYKTYTFLNMVLLLPAWFGWLIWENYQNNVSKEAIGLTIAMSVGLAIGASIGLYMYFKIQNEASQIIKQIEEQ